MASSGSTLPASGQGPVQDALDRIRRAYAGAPLPLKILTVVVCCVVGFPVALALAPYAVISGSRSAWATASVTIWGVALVSGLAHSNSAYSGANPSYGFLLLVVAVAFAAHAGTLGRWLVPCRTVAWTVVLALLPGIVAYRLLGRHGPWLIGPALAWLIACMILSWRLTKA